MRNLRVAVRQNVHRATQRRRHRGVYSAVPTRMLMTGGCPTWPATSLRGACGCVLTQIRARTIGREPAHADARWPVMLPVAERVSGDGRRTAVGHVRGTDRHAGGGLRRDRLPA